jgi:hypothetical protein
MAATTQLAADLTVEPSRTTRREELVARGALQNRGDEPVEIDLAPLGSPSLALEIVDAAGAPVRLPPPPVPRGGGERVFVAPNERRAVEYRGFLPAWTPPGAYRARLRYVGGVRRLNEPDRTAEVASGWAEFLVAAE